MWYLFEIRFFNQIPMGHNKNVIQRSAPKTKLQDECTSRAHTSNKNQVCAIKCVSKKDSRRPRKNYSEVEKGGCGGM